MRGGGDSGRRGSERRDRNTEINTSYERMCKEENDEKGMISDAKGRGCGERQERVRERMLDRNGWMRPRVRMRVRM